MEERYHYPPELLELLVDTIPRLVKGKQDVFLFFRGAGITRSLLSDLQEQYANNPDSINKFHIARTVLSRLNESGDRTLKERREVLKRVVEYEDFSSCWPEERLKAQGLVSRVRDVINVKDSFTKMRQEREAELQKHREAQSRELEKVRFHQEILADIRQDFYHLFAINNPHERGLLLEKVLNRLFEASGILVKEPFRRVEPGKGVVEQVDGVVELEGHIYLVEMKWLKEPVGVGDVSQHLVRVFNRSASRGIFISYSEYTTPAIETCKESLNGNAVFVLCTLQEFVLLLENNEKSLKEFLKAKINSSIIDKQPFTAVF